MKSLFHVNFQFIFEKSFEMLLKFTFIFFIFSRIFLSSALDISPPSKAPYFDFIIDRVEIMEFDESFVNVSVKIRKVNGYRTLVGTIEFFKPFGSDVIIKANLLKKQGNEYRYTPFKYFDTPVCTWAATDGELYFIISTIYNFFN